MRGKGAGKKLVACYFATPQEGRDMLTQLENPVFQLGSKVVPVPALIVGDSDHLLAQRRDQIRQSWSSAERAQRARLAQMLQAQLLSTLAQSIVQPNDSGMFR